MRICCINLDRSRDRWQHFTRINAHLSQVERYAAVEGKAVDLQALISAGTITENILSRYTRGALGNALSHLALWERAAREPETLTVCEDDAIFNRRFEVRAEALLSELPTGWDFVLWGWNFDVLAAIQLLPGVCDSVIDFDQSGLRRHTSEFQGAELSARLFRLHRALGLPCYSISPAGAARLRARCIPLRSGAILMPGRKDPIANVAIDVMANGFYPELSAWASLPPLVVTKNEREISTVQDGRVIRPAVRS